MLLLPTYQQECSAFTNLRASHLSPSVSNSHERPPPLATTPQLDTAIVARLIEVAAKINPKIIVAIAPYLSKLDVNVLKRLIPSIAALNPDLLVNTLNLVAGLTPEAWEALLHIVELGVPAINLVGWKLNLLPVSVGAPAPFSQARGSVFQLPSFLG